MSHRFLCIGNDGGSMEHVWASLAMTTYSLLYNKPTNKKMEGKFFE